MLLRNEARLIFKCYLKESKGKQIQGSLFSKVVSEQKINKYSKLTQRCVLNVIFEIELFLHRVCYKFVMLDLQQLLYTPHVHALQEDNEVINVIPLHNNMK